MISIATTAGHKLWHRFIWAIDHGYPVSKKALGLYRIGLGIYFLAFNTIPDLRWMAGYPDDFYSPPPGLSQVFGGVMPRALLIFLEFGIVIAIVMMTVGYRTRLSSWLVGAGGGLLVNGIFFSFGKIDHTLIVWLVPLVFASSGWGGAYSVDAARGKAHKTHAYSGSRAIFMMGLFLAISFFTAAAPKLAGGWWSFEESAVQNHFLKLRAQLDRNHLLAEFFADLDNRIFWELMDWFTLFFEFGMAFVLLWPNWQRRAVLVAWAFHIGTLLMMNITFYGPLLAYPVLLLPLLSAARADRIVGFFTKYRVVALAALGGLAVAAAFGAGVIWEVFEAFDVHPFTRDVVFFGAGFVAMAYVALRTELYETDDHPPELVRK